MPRKRALMACSNYWTSPFQVGSHHLARGLVRAGYDVAFVSDPLSPWHLCRGWSPDLRRRLAIHRGSGQLDLDGRLWAYVLAAWLTPHHKPILRSEWVHRHWQRWTWPNVAAAVRNQGFASVDLLYLDSPRQAFWLDAVSWRQSVYRVADYNPHFEKFTPATRIMEEELARRVDLVVYPSRQLQGYAEQLGARRAMLLANGVDYEHFACPAAVMPAEYRQMRGPIAVYVGVIPAWFHFDWLRQAAERIPEMSFVLIGPDISAARRPGRRSGQHPHPWRARLRRRPRFASARPHRPDAVRCGPKPARRRGVAAAEVVRLFGEWFAGGVLGLGQSSSVGLPRATVRNGGGVHCGAATSRRRARGSR